MSKERGSRGADWERLEVHFNVAWRSRRFYNSLTSKERKRGKLTTMLDAFEGKANPYARVSRLWWRNPDAETKGADSRNRYGVLTDPLTISEHLLTLNRGDFSVRILRYDLAKLGGRLEAQPPVERKKKPRRKAHRSSKKLASVRTKRHVIRHKKRVRRH
jgi:hypothetical protein